MYLQRLSRARRCATLFASALLVTSLAAGLAQGASGAALLQDPVQGEKPTDKPADKPVQTPPQTPPVDDGHNHGDEKSLLGRQSQPVDPNAKLVMDFGAEKFDMGTVRQGEKREHVFQMSSGGTAPLVIYQAKPSCGCTLGEVRVEDDQGQYALYKMGDPIQPGRKVQITATVDTASKQGNVTVRIQVYTNDPVTTYQLALSGNVEPFLIVTPTALMFGDLSADSVKEGLVTIRTQSGEPMMLSISDSPPIPKPKGMEIALTPVEAGADGRAALWHLDVDLGPGLEEGQVGYRVSLITDHEMPSGKETPDGKKQMYNAGVTINGRVLGVLTCVPQYFSMGLVRPGQVISRMVKLTSNDPNFGLDKVTTTIRGFDGQEFPWQSAFTTNLKPVPGENALEIELHLDGLPEGADGTFKGQVLIATGHPEKPEIPVSFSGVARAGVTPNNPPPKGTKPVPPPSPEEKKSGGEEKKDG